jgi:hypothetical protein
MQAMLETDAMDDDALLAALGIELKPLKVLSRTPSEERLIAGFEDIVRFYRAQGRLPKNDDKGDIFERLYAVRLEQLRQLPEAQVLLAPLDSMGVLSDSALAQAGKSMNVEALDDDALLAALGTGTRSDNNHDLTQLTHVRSYEERKAAQLIGQNTRCHDFEIFKALFKTVQQDLDTGIRLARRFNEDADINQGDFFILGGLVAYVAQMDALIKDEFSKWDGRLRVVYSNGTESNILRRSLQKALYKDPAGRKISDSSAGPLFADSADEGDTASGTIYVLRSLSSHPYIAQHRKLIHKIGVTGGSVGSRIAGAQKDATYLLAGVEVVATYELHNINRTKLEGVFHRIFAAAQLDLTIEDRFGNPVKPREWFLVPLNIIDDAVQRIQNGSITRVIYDSSLVKLVEL